MGRGRTHISLHGSEGEFKCGQCDYATSRIANLTAHCLIHPPKKKVPAKPRKPPLRSFSCSKCPAVFYKQDRFDRHLELHGKNYKYGCKDCDYSVRFAANLIKHRNLHAATKAEAENGLSPIKTPEQVLPAVKPLVENSNLNFFDPDEKKVMFICDRCPYAQNRKDAVQSHQRRHWLRDGFKCPYCDYTSMQNGFVHSHIKMHIQPLGLFPPQAFMKYESFKIFVKEDDEEERLLFDDQEMLKHKNEDVSKHKRKRKSEDSSSKKKKLSSYDKDFANIPNNSKVPVVVLSDVLANKELMKWAPKLKIPKLKLTKCADSEKKYSKLNISYDSEAKLSWTKPKPSLVVKISKVGDSSNEKTMYSVCTKTSEPSPPIPITNNLKDFDTANDCDPSNCSEDIEKDREILNASVCDDSIKEESESIPSKDLKSVSSEEVVPETVDVSLCEQLDLDSKDAGIPNGETGVQLPEEIVGEL